VTRGWRPAHPARLGFVVGSGLVDSLRLRIGSETEEHVLANPGERSRAALSRLRRWTAARIRGQLILNRLVGQGLQLGRAVYVAPTAFLDPGHPWLIEIGEETLVGPWAIVLAHDTSTRLHTGHTLIGRVTIGKRVYVGHGAIIMPGSTIGDEAVIAPGAMVHGNIPARAVVIGNPAQVISDVDSFRQQHREAIARGPVWPIPGWTLANGGISEARREAQRDALADRCGYLESPI
jgi:maltose O-acetyltransferase